MSTLLSLKYFIVTSFQNLHSFDTSYIREIRGFKKCNTFAQQHFHIPSGEKRKNMEAFGRSLRTFGISMGTFGTNLRAFGIESLAYSWIRLAHFVHCLAHWEHSLAHSRRRWAQPKSTQNAIFRSKTQKMIKNAFKLFENYKNRTSPIP